MLYIIVEQNRGKTYLINNEVYQSRFKADEERIYLQPEYDNLLEVKEIV